MRIHKALLAVALAAASLSPSAASADEGTFSARAVPAPPLGSDMSPDRCFSGTEGVHKVTHPYTPASDGSLTVMAEGFVGDWDLAITDGQGEILAASWMDATLGGPSREVIRWRVHSGAPLNLVACNASSPTVEIVVRYRLDPSDDYRAGGPVADGFRHLMPGSLADLHEEVPVNFVFLGYERNQINAKAFESALPSRYRPIARSRDWYGIREYLGIDYSYDYRTAFTKKRYEKKFFRMLASIATPGHPTEFQAKYNQQAENVLGVGTNDRIDAVSVERWLAQHPPRGIDTEENTVFFVNWYGRPDFRFHTYQKMGEPISDSSLDYGSRDSHQLIAWGGTPPDDEETGWGDLSRVWFHDLSAGPDWRTGNWQLDEISAGGEDGYVIPPVWEYAPGGYRDPAQLTGDLARIARYVAIDLLFTTSPLYPPGLTPPLMPNSINLDLNTYEGSPGTDASARIVQPEIVANKIRQLLPLHQVDADHQDLDFYEPQFAACYASYSEWGGVYANGTGQDIPLRTGPGCHPGRPYGVWSNLFVHNALTLDRVLDDGSSVDYEVAGLNYVPPSAELGGGWYAWADDNQWDGTQSMTHNVIGPQWIGTGGLTDILVHEFGHHFGLSHPHDGFDWEEDREFSSDGEFLFAYVGDETNSVMSYLHNNNEFSQFDRDNMNRWLTAAYLTQLNTITRQVLASSGAPRATELLLRSDDAVGEAKEAFASHRYLDALGSAKAAHALGVQAAREAGVTLEPDRSGVRVRSSAEETAAAMGFPPGDHAYAYVDSVEDFAMFQSMRRRSA
jgi:hypothetical protein